MKNYFLIAALFFGMFSCNDTPHNPNIPNAYINFSLEPNSTMNPELNTVSGWMYIKPHQGSRGIIIYRYSLDEFKAYERQSPNDPNHCGELSRMIVEFPFVVDTCLNVKYSILDGSIITPGYQGYPLIQYHTQYDGTTLRVFN